jgi:hypothetical protein
MQDWALGLIRKAVRQDESRKEAAAILAAAPNLKRGSAQPNQQHFPHG